MNHDQLMQALSEEIARLKQCATRLAGLLPNDPATYTDFGPTDYNAIFEVYKRACEGTGFWPEVAFGIFMWETGRGKRGVPWIKANNPGGIKDTKLFSYGTYTAEPTKKEGIVVYESFPTRRVGLESHLSVLLKDRYLPARGLTMREQVAAIAKAGYIGGTHAEVQEWIKGVTDFTLSAAKGVLNP